MERLSAAEARKRLPEAVQRVDYGGERFILTVHGKARAALVSIADLQTLERLEDEEDARIAEAALAEYDAGRMKAYSLDEAATLLKAKDEQPTRPRSASREASA